MVVILGLAEVGMGSKAQPGKPLFLVIPLKAVPG